MKLNKEALGLALGIVWGVTVFLATWVIIMRGGTGEMLSKLGRFYFGYTVSAGGSIIGLIYGFIDGFIGGWVIGLLYNAFTKGEAKPAQK
jgi:hypothetical protein